MKMYKLVLTKKMKISKNGNIPIRISEVPKTIDQGGGYTVLLLLFSG